MAGLLSRPERLSDCIKESADLELHAGAAVPVAHAGHPERGRVRDCDDRRPANDEFTALDMATKRALVITRIEIEKTIKAGGKWSPHEKN